MKRVPQGLERALIKELARFRGITRTATQGECDQGEWFIKWETTVKGKMQHNILVLTEDPEQLLRKIRRSNGGTNEGEGQAEKPDAGNEGNSDSLSERWLARLAHWLCPNESGRR